MSDPKYVLCQDCLKQKTYTDERHDGDEKCECGGDFCGCLYCTETKAEILVTKRDVHGWTAEGGRDVIE